MLSPPHVVFLEQFKSASSEGAIFELKLRLLADKTPSLQQFAHEQKLEDIENKVTEYFGNALSEDEKNTIVVCHQLRNKILHCNFSAARKKLVESGAESISAGVKRIDINGLINITQIEAKITQAITNNPGSFESVSESATTTPGRIFGWLLEMGAAGDLLKAILVFQEASAILDRLLVIDRI